MPDLADPPKRYNVKPVDPAHLAGDLIWPGHPLFGLIWINPDRVSGAPCFYGTRVPIKSLFDYLAGGETLEEFLENFPPITREQAEAVLNLAGATLLDVLPKADTNLRWLQRMGLASWDESKGTTYGG